MKTKTKIESLKVEPITMRVWLSGPGPNEGCKLDIPKKFLRAVGIYPCHRVELVTIPGSDQIIIRKLEQKPVPKPEPGRQRCPVTFLSPEQVAANRKTDGWMPTRRSQQ